MAPRASSEAPTPRAGASICAGTVRSCRSTRDAFTRCRSTSSLTISARRSTRAHSTSASAIRIFSTARRTPAASSSAVSEQFPGITYDVTIKIEHLLKHAEMLPLLARPGACSSRAPSNRSTTTCCCSSRRGTRAPISSAPCSCAATAGVTLIADVRRLHAVDDARGIRRAAADD